MKAFSLQLQELNDGSTHAALTAAFADLLRAVQHSGKAGALTVKLKVAPATKGATGYVDKVTITAEQKLDMPKAEQPTDFYFLTDEGETSRNHPRQHTLELRDVSSNPPLSTALKEVNAS